MVGDDPGPVRLANRQKAVIALRAWFWSVVMALAVRRVPLPGLVAQLSRTRRASSFHVPPRHLGWMVGRVLRVGSHSPRCLISALVLYRLLKAQGEAAELVIGLPELPQDKNAHAWVEVDGVDVGPPPGSRGHVELGRYG